MITDIPTLRSNLDDARKDWGFAKRHLEDCRKAHQGAMQDECEAYENYLQAKQEYEESIK